MNTSNSATANSTLPARVSPWIPSSAFYLAHEPEVDCNIREGEAEIGRSVSPLSESRPELYARLERARHEISTRDLAKH